jgi:SWI/SNF-related matrix-associated actin-dependent regulator of chromatin subfamily A-like protein 1
MKLENYQETGAHFCAKLPASGIFDEPGLGKTPLSVRWLDLTGTSSAVVLTTASHVYSYAKEVMDWQGIPRTVGVDDWDKDVVVTTHGRMARMDVANLPKRNGLIVDEAHYLKEPSSQRTRAAYGEDCAPGQGLVGRIDSNVLLLSGSITPNYASELWTHFARLWPHLIQTKQGRTMTQLQFAQRFTAGKMDPRTGKWVPRYNRRVDELKALLSKISLARTHESVGNQMPPARIVDVPLAGSLNEFLAKNTKQADELRAELNAMSKFILMGRGKGLTGPQILTAALNDSAIQQSSLRRLMATAKADACAAYVRDLLAGGLDKVLVFGVHSTALKAIAEKLSRFGVAVVTGSTPKAKRFDEANRFQTDPKCRVFVGNVTAAGEAITLTAANRLVMLESTWTPKDDMQVIARCRRYGQTRTVQADYLTIPEAAIEELVVRVNRRKASGNKALWGR